MAYLPGKAYMCLHTRLWIRNLLKTRIQVSPVSILNLFPLGLMLEKKHGPFKLIITHWQELLVHRRFTSWTDLARGILLRGWDGWMASLMKWTWTWPSSRRWWGTGGLAHVSPWVQKSQTWLGNWITTTNAFLTANKVFRFKKLSKTEMVRLKWTDWILPQGKYLRGAYESLGQWWLR